MLTERGANIPSARQAGHASAQASSSKSTSRARPPTRTTKGTRLKPPSTLVTIPEDTVVALPAAQPTKQGRPVGTSARAAVVVLTPSAVAPTLDDKTRADIMKAVDFLGQMEVGPGDEAYQLVRSSDWLRRWRLQGWCSPRCPPFCSYVQSYDFIPDVKSNVSKDAHAGQRFDVFRTYSLAPDDLAQARVT